MKKLGILAMPLVVISFLGSCNKNTCIVTAEDSDCLSFTTTDNRSLNGTSITKNKDFTFNMKIKDESRNGYKLPTTLDIYIGNSEIKLATGYTIVETTYCFEATVTIEANRITDKVTIVGKAVPLSRYYVDIVTYGTNHDYQQEWVDVDKPLDIHFLEKDSLALPEAKNVFIKFDSSDWLNPLDEGSEKYFDYDQTTHRLTILENKVRSNVTIRVRSPEYKILDDLYWNQISDYSSKGWAPYIFYIGDQKIVPVDGLNHTVRIIGFNHDTSDVRRPDVPKIGITFEFVELISDSKGALTAQRNASGNNENFPESTLNYFLNKNSNCVFNKLSEDLRNAIKEVDKIVGHGGGGEIEDYKTKLFPLSTSELTNRSDLAEGKQYEYYKKHSDRRKKPVGKTSTGNYWIRTPTSLSGESSNYSYYVSEGGNISPIRVSGRYAVAPAFCV